MDLNPSSHEVSICDESGVNLPCAGTIISSYFILTVASCLYRKTQNKLTIKTKIQSGIGIEQNSTSTQQIRNIERVIFHPGFKNSSYENDVAILVLDEEFDANFNPPIKIMPVFSMLNETSTSKKMTKIVT